MYIYPEGLFGIITPTAGLGKRKPRTTAHSQGFKYPVVYNIVLPGGV